MRKAFIESLIKQAQTNKRIFLLTGDLGANLLEPFRDKFPQRFLNVGVAEANLVTTAAGLASTGYIPVIYSIATFVTMRAFEQIRDTIAYPKAHVVILGSGGGLAYSKAGFTHFALEDIAVMSTLPNITIISPSDREQSYQVAKAAVSCRGPLYVRFEVDSSQETSIPGRVFKIGKASKIKNGEKVAIAATGAKLYAALDVADILNRHNINAAVYSFQTIKPLDTACLKNIFNTFEVVVSLEEHSISGGLGSAIGESLLQTGSRKPLQLLKFGIKVDKKLVSGSYEYLLKYFGLEAPQIARSILERMKS